MVPGVNINPNIVPDGAWDAFDPFDGSPMEDWTFISGTSPAENYTAFDRLHSWQEPGQWILDQNNGMHRVLARVEPDDPASDPVRVQLRRPPVPVSANEGFINGVKVKPSPYYYIDNDPSTAVSTVLYDVVTNIWYVPTQVSVYADPANDGQNEEQLNVTLTPVYVMVREL
jgi:hypothetical protein